MTSSKINMTILSALFACAILVAPASIMSVQAQNYDAGEEYEGFTFDHDEVSEEEALEAADNYEEEECIEERADLSDELVGYEVVKCLKDADY